MDDSPLNRCFKTYKENRTDDNLQALLAEVGRYARAVTAQWGTNNPTLVWAQRPGTETEISQAVIQLVWLKLPEFDGRAKFSSWVFRIAQNVSKSLANRKHPGVDVQYLDWKNYEGDYCGSRSASGDETGEKVPLSNMNPDEDDCRGIILDDLMESFSEQDRQIVDLYCQNWKPSEIAYHFRVKRRGINAKHNAKWASNQLARIKKLLKKAWGLAKAPTSVS